MGPLLTVLIIEVSLFQSVHNSRFDCIHVLLIIIYEVTSFENLYYYNTIDCQYKTYKLIVHATSQLINLIMYFAHTCTCTYTL